AIEIVETRSGEMLEGRGERVLAADRTSSRRLALDQKRRRKTWDIPKLGGVLGGEFSLAPGHHIAVARKTDRGGKPRPEGHASTQRPPSAFAASRASIQVAAAPGAVSAASGPRAGISSWPRSR